MHLNNNNKNYIKYTNFRQKASTNKKTKPHPLPPNTNLLTFPLFPSTSPGHFKIFPIRFSSHFSFLGLFLKMKCCSADNHLSPPRAFQSLGRPYLCWKYPDNYSVEERIKRVHYLFAIL